jgi:pyruvate dehydrogenase E2 component (dihydrolipoamide acetyltransferase)
MSSYIEMPKLSDTMTEGTVVKWRKGIGDTVEMGDVVADIETDKAVMELEVFGGGTLSEIYVAEGGKARIGDKLARLATGGREDSTGEQEQPIDEPAPVSSAQTTSTAGPAAAELPSASPRQTAPEPQRRIKASPLARKLAAAKQVDLQSIQGSGPGGRVVARDVESAAAPVKRAEASVSGPAAAVSAPTPAAVAAKGDKRIPLSGMRKIIAERLVASKTQIPHFYLEIEVDTSELTCLRRQINGALEKTGQGKLTINDFVLRAVTMAAVRVPQANATFASDAIIEYANVHLSIAVAVDEGLVTPVVRQAQKKSLREISESVKDLAARARTKKLKPEEYQGGTITISNLGNYGIERFSAIINPPQAVILAIGAIVKKPVLSPEGQVVPGERMSVSLSADHRVVDGAVGARFLAEMRQLLENPTLLLI